MKFVRAAIGLAFVFFFGCMAGALSDPAEGQTPFQNTVPIEMQRIGDWTVRCFAAESISPCDMHEQQNEKSSNDLKFAVSIAYVPSLDRHTMQIMLPLGVSIAKGVKIRTSAFRTPPLHYRFCDSAGCHVDLIMPNVSIESLERVTDNPEIDVVADDGHAYSLALSLKGFAEAHSRMVELADSKAAYPPGNAKVAN